jgi:hypothetical protein
MASNTFIWGEITIANMEHGTSDATAHGIHASCVSCANRFHASCDAG